MTKVMFNFQYHKGKLELKYFGMNLLSTFCTCVVYIDSFSQLVELLLLYNVTDTISRKN